MNPPDMEGNYSLTQKRLWHFAPEENKSINLSETIKKFQEYYKSTNHLELSYYDGEEQMLILKDEDLREACAYFINCYKQFENYSIFLKIYVTEKLDDPNQKTEKVKLPSTGSGTAKLLYRQLTVSSLSTSVNSDRSYK